MNWKQDTENEHRVDTPTHVLRVWSVYGTCYGSVAKRLSEKGTFERLFRCQQSTLAQAKQAVEDWFYLT